MAALSVARMQFRYGLSAIDIGGLRNPGVIRASVLEDSLYLLRGLWEGPLGHSAYPRPVLLPLRVPSLVSLLCSVSRLSVECSERQAGGGGDETGDGLWKERQSGPGGRRRRRDRARARERAQEGRSRTIAGRARGVGAGGERRRRKDEERGDETRRKEEEERRGGEETRRRDEEARGEETRAQESRLCPRGRVCCASPVDRPHLLSAGAARAPPGRRAKLSARSPLPLCFAPPPSPRPGRRSAGSAPPRTPCSCDGQPRCVLSTKSTQLQATAVYSRGATSVFVHSINLAFRILINLAIIF